MKTLSQLLNEAEDRFNEKFIKSNLFDSVPMDEVDNIKDFLKTELEKIVKESFNNTNAQEREEKIEIECPHSLDCGGCMDKQDKEAIIYNQALRELINNQNQFLNN